MSFLLLDNRFTVLASEACMFLITEACVKLVKVISEKYFRISRKTVQFLRNKGRIPINKNAMVSGYFGGIPVNVVQRSAPGGGPGEVVQIPAHMMEEFIKQLKAAAEAEQERNPDATADSEKPGTSAS